MQTSHEAAVAHLKKLDRAEHPEIEELLAVARMYPVDVQAACADAVKRGGDASFIEPIKAIADRQAVEVQELLDALTFAGEGGPKPVADHDLRDLRHDSPRFGQLGAAEPVVIASEPFKIVDLMSEQAFRAGSAAGWPAGTIGVDLGALDDHGSASTASDPTLTVHADDGDSGGASAGAV